MRSIEQRSEWGGPSLMKPCLEQANTYSNSNTVTFRVTEKAQCIQQELLRERIQKAFPICNVRETATIKGHANNTNE